VAVHATDFAFIHLSPYGLPRIAAAGESLDLGALVSQMIEVEYDRIILAAINTWVVRKVGQDPTHQFETTSALMPSDVGDMPLFVLPVPATCDFSLAA
jgi:hypothetical protein